MKKFETVTAKVKIRRDGIYSAVNPVAEQTDGNTYKFYCGWPVRKKDGWGDMYIGEFAMIPDDPNWPRYANHWVASGDLEIIN